MDTYSTEANVKRFDWWRAAFLAALTGAADLEIPAKQVATDAANIANHAAPFIAQAFDHFVVKGLIEPEKAGE